MNVKPLMAVLVLLLLSFVSVAFSAQPPGSETETTYRISGRVTEGDGAPLPDVEIATNGGGGAVTEGDGSYAIGGLITGTYSITPTLAGYSFRPLSRTVTVPPDAGGQTFTGSPDRRKRYLPLVSRPAPEMAIAHVEVTQAVQDPGNSVPLVEGRPTAARIYATLENARHPISTTVSLTGYRDGQSLGSLRVGPKQAPEAAARGDYGSTFNASLPVGWLSGAVTLTAKIDVDDAIDEADEENNVISLTAQFHAVPPLDLKLVPINYTHLPDGTQFPAYPADEDEIVETVMDIFPLNDVRISYRAPVDWAGDLSKGSEWSRLLRRIVDIKNADGSPYAEAYYALVPTRNENGDRYPRAWAGYGTYGWVRAAVGTVESGGSTAAHELGHNFGRRHAPCGDPADVDGDYPYPDASIGQFGLDVTEGRVWTPGAPDEAKDFMSYCGPEWVSDYTYRALFHSQMIAGTTVQRPATDGLLVRATLAADGATTILPVYALSSVSPGNAPGEGDVTIEVVGEGGEVLAAHPAGIYEAGEGEERSRAISVVVPEPAGTVSRVRLRQDGRVIAERQLRTVASRSAPAGGERGADGVTVRWERTGAPALVRYTADGGAQWTTVGVDVVGGELTLDPGVLQEEGGTFEVSFGR